jgi:hypothetical protein
MIDVRSICSLVIAVLIVISSAFAQPQPSTGSTSDLSYWIHGGPSITTLGVGTHGGLAVEFNRHVLSARATSTDVVFGNETWDVALLYSRSMYAGNFFLSAGTGVSVIGGRGYTHLLGHGSDTGNPLDPTLGFPLQGQISWTPTAYGAIGLYGFANVNTGQPFGGVGLQIRIGHLN